MRLLQSIDDRLGDQDTRLQAIETAINKLVGNNILMGCKHA